MCIPKILIAFKMVNKLLNWSYKRMFLILLVKPFVRQDEDSIWYFGNLSYCRVVSAAQYSRVHI